MTVPEPIKVLVKMCYSTAPAQWHSYLTMPNVGDYLVHGYTHWEVVSRVISDTEVTLLVREEEEDIGIH